MRKGCHNKNAQKESKNWNCEKPLNKIAPHSDGCGLGQKIHPPFKGGSVQYYRYQNNVYKAYHPRYEGEKAQLVK